MFTNDLLTWLIDWTYTYKELYLNKYNKLYNLKCFIIRNILLFYIFM